MTSNIPIQQEHNPDNHLVSNDTLAVWRRENQRLLHGSDDETGEQPTQFELGLRLLREFKNVQDDLQMKSILADALYGENPVEDYITALEQLADQATTNGYYGLQDACLLIAEALVEPPKDGSITGSSDLDDWPLLIRAYLQEPSATAIGKIIKVLHNPDLHLRISEAEFAILETLLTVGLNVKKSTTTDTPVTRSVAPAVKAIIPPPDEHRPISDYIASIEPFAKQAAIEEYHGLQNVCLLLVEALHELSKEPLNAKTIALLELLDDWSTLVNAYKDGSELAVTQLIAMLRHPDLNLFLSDNEFAMLENLLADDIGLLIHPTKQGNEQITCLQPSIEPSPMVESPVQQASRDDYIYAIEQLADQVAAKNFYALQDASLLLVEALRELSPEDFASKAELVTALNQWAELIDAYQVIPHIAIPEILNILRSAQSPLADDEFIMLENALIADAGVTIDSDSEEKPSIEQSPLVESPTQQASRDAYIHNIEQLADQVAAKGFYALQDASLLLVEALRELSPEDFASKTELVTALNQWAELIDAYQVIPHIAIPEILNILRSAELLLPLAEDEFALLENALTADSSATTDSDTASEENPSTEQSLLVEESPMQQAIRDDYIYAIEQLADQVAAKGFYALQDASLLLVEALRELSPEDFASKTELVTALNQWAELIDAYQVIPHIAISEILNILRTAQSPLAEDEFVMLENALTADAGITISSDSVFEQQPSIEQSLLVENPVQQAVRDDYIHNIEQLADQVAAKGFYALQDASLLLVEALCELSSDEFASKTELVTALNQWAELIDAYQVIPHIAIPEILNILRFTELQLPLAEDEFALLQAALTADSEVATVNDEVISSGQDDTQQADEKDSVFARLETALNISFAPEITATAIETIDVDTVSGGGLETTLNITFAPEITDAPVEITDVETVNIEPVATPQPTKTNTSHPLSKAARELVELLMMETEMVNAHLSSINMGDLASIVSGLDNVEEELERYANAGAMAGFDGLAQVCKHVAANVLLFHDDANQFTADKLALLQTWVELVKTYLTRFTEDDAGTALLSQLRAALWALPLSPEASAAILAQMQTSSTNVAETPEQTRKQVANNEDVSLAIPSDVNKELLDILLQELPTYMEQFSESIQRLQSGGSVQDVEVAQRVAHTIKGSANTVGVKGIAVLTHHLEDILLAFAKERKLPKGAVCHSLINASDCLEAMIESLLGMGDAPSEAKTVLQEILNWANQIDQQGIPDTDEQAPTAAPREVSEKADDSATPASDTTANQENAQAAQVAMVRVPTDQIENLFRLSSESIILNGQTFERHRRIKNQIQAMEAQFILLQQLGLELDQLIDLKDLSGRSLVNTGREFDALEMDQYNELHTASRRMVEAAIDAREIGTDIKKELELMSGVLDYQQRLVIDTQESIMQTRLIPVVSIAARLQRGARQTSRLTGKQCDLILSGEQLLIDGDTLNSMVDPLMHLLRNAIDHGIESEEDRTVLGKPLTGKISIDFDREGNSILVRVRDDGRGLDYGAIRAAAEKRGVLQPGQSVSEEELKRFILQPNFSTRTVSTQTSGRGVGMDAVRFQVINLGGTLTLHSEQGKGMTVELRVPLPLSRAHALLANVCHHKVAITSKGLLQIIYAGAGELKMLNDGEVLVVDDDVYPVVKLEDLLHVTDHRKDRHPHSAVLLVQNEDKITAVLVSSINDSRDVVIKSLGHYMGKISGFIGATILGDGSVIPVLDIPELLRTPTHAARGAGIATADAFDAQSNQPSVLVVDDSLSQRRALEQILQDAGYKVYIARDGIEAVEFLSHVKPNVVLTDLEMPRMNGIELISHIRTQARTKNLPIIMITSRTTQKHKQMAQDAGVDFYLSKPVQDDELSAKIHDLIVATEQREQA